MKIFLSILAGVVVFIALVVGAAFYMTSGAASTATAFFNDIKNHQYSTAYNCLSQDFKADTSQAQLKTFLEKNKLLQIKDTSWGSREITGERGSVQGSVITDAGSNVPVKLSLVKENGAWKIFSIGKPPSGTDTNDQGSKLPPNEKLVSLTDETMQKFAEAVKAKNFVKFRAYVAHLWQRQYGAEKFKEVFKPFTDANIDMLPALKVTAPQFNSKPSINDDGVMEIDGHYPTSPSRIMFKLKYIYEGLTWKLVGLNVHIK